MILIGLVRAAERHRRIPSQPERASALRQVGECRLTFRFAARCLNWPPAECEGRLFGTRHDRPELTGSARPVYRCWSKRMVDSRNGGAQRSFLIALFFVFRLAW